jgi:hypothetical protein
MSDKLTAMMIAIKTLRKTPIRAIASIIISVLEAGGTIFGRLSQSTGKNVILPILFIKPYNLSICYAIIKITPIVI